MVYPELTGLVHISGVDDAGLTVGEMRDADRGLVTADDRLGNLAQLRKLVSGGYAGPFSFEPFAASVQDLADPGPAIAASMERVRGGLSVAAA